jgi:hypothetical protein
VRGTIVLLVLRILAIRETSGQSGLSWNAGAKAFGFKCIEDGGVLNLDVTMVLRLRLAGQALQFGCWQELTLARKYMLPRRTNAYCNAQ